METGVATFPNYQLGTYANPTPNSYVPFSNLALQTPQANIPPMPVPTMASAAGTTGATAQAASSGVPWLSILGGAGDLVNGILGFINARQARKAARQQYNQMRTDWKEEQGYQRGQDKIRNAMAQEQIRESTLNSQFNRDLTRERENKGDLAGLEGRLFEAVNRDANFRNHVLKMMGV